MSDSGPARTLLVASMGGHWVQLLQLRPVWRHTAHRYCTTLPPDPDDVGSAAVDLVLDANKRRPDRCLLLLLQVAYLVVRYRPRRIVTTGAAPGVLALICGRAIGARGLWLDSLANARQLSLSGRLARRVAHVCLSQWQSVAAAAGLPFHGATFDLRGLGDG